MLKNTKIFYLFLATMLTISTFVGRYGNQSKNINDLLQLYAYKELYFLGLNIVVIGIFIYKVYSLVRHSFLKTYMAVFYKELLELLVLLFMIFALFITIKLFSICLWTTILLVEVGPIIQNSGLPIDFNDVVISFMKSDKDISGITPKGDIPPLGENIVTAGLTSKGEPYVCANIKRIISDILQPSSLQAAGKAGKYYMGIEDIECFVGDAPFSGKKN